MKTEQGVSLLARRICACKTADTCPDVDPVTVKPDPQLPAYRLQGI